MSSFVFLPSSFTALPSWGKSSTCIRRWTLPQHCEFLFLSSNLMWPKTIPLLCHDLISIPILIWYYLFVLFSILFLCLFSFFLKKNLIIVPLSLHRLVFIAYFLFFSFFGFYVCLSCKFLVAVCIPVWSSGKLGPAHLPVCVCVSGRCPFHQSIWLLHLSDWRKKKNQRRLKTRKRLQGRWGRKRKD